MGIDRLSAKEPELPPETKRTHSNTAPETFPFLAMVVGFLWGIGQFLYQVFFYLKVGYWTPKSAYQMFETRSFANWMRYPDDWKGLANFLLKTCETLSPGFLLMGLGFIALIISSWGSEGKK